MSTHDTVFQAFLLGFCVILYWPNKPPPVHILYWPNKPPPVQVIRWHVESLGGFRVISILETISMLPVLPTVELGNVPSGKEGNG